jgi:hypothetical protein
VSNKPCEDIQAAGHLVWHHVTFRGPEAGMSCHLPEGQQGVVEHEFINGSIYQQTFATMVSTMPDALQWAGSPVPPPVVVAKASKGPFRSQPTIGIATQVLEHVPGSGVVLPHTATAEFETYVTPPWNTPSSPAAPPTVSVTLTS